MAEKDEKTHVLLAGNFFSDQDQRGGILKQKSLNNSRLHIVVWVLCEKSSLYLVRIHKLSLPRLTLPDI